MRWDRLFDDLEAQLADGRESDTTEEEGEWERHRLAGLRLRDRMLAAVVRAEPVTLRLHGGLVRRVVVATVGADWLSGAVDTGPGHPAVSARRDLLVPLSALEAVDLAPDAGDWSVREPGDARERSTLRSASAPRVGLPVVLRDLCRRRTPVDVHTRSGRMHGTLDRVGGDHVDLAVHEPGRPRRRGEVSAVRILPFASLLSVGF